MKPRIRTCNILATTIALLVLAAACPANVVGTGEEPEGDDMRIVFLHHSTGENIWKGGVPECFDAYNRDRGTDYHIENLIFPKRSPYGWNNYPYDYWNIWVRHAGPEPYMEEPTIEILAGEYDVIIFKHCFPVSDILPDTGNPAISSEEKRIENYKLQYEALKNKLREFPKTIFIIWTAPPRAEVTSLKARIVEFIKRKSVQKEYAARAKEFVDWVRSEWDEPGDNIFIWDYHELATEGGVFLKKEYSQAPGNSHPNSSFAQTAANAFCQRIIDIIEDRGDDSRVTGESKQEH